MDSTKLRQNSTENDPPETQSRAEIEPRAELQSGAESESQAEAQTESRTETSVETTADTQTSQAAVVDTAVNDAAAAETISSTEPVKNKKSHKKLIIIVVAVILAVLGVGGAVFALVLNQNGNLSDGSDDQSATGSVIPDKISNFDLAFLRSETTNQLYSPLSIKYALGMLEAGAAGDSRQQIESAIGTLTPQKYPNNKNMSFANALFINDKLPDDTIKSSYIATISDRFGAEILQVPFTSAVSINNWVSDKTFGLINDLVTDEMLKPAGAPEQYFVLVNALAIDMEWVNKIQSEDKDYSVKFPHISYGSYVDSLRFTGFTAQPFNDAAIDVNALRIAATINKYNILNELGVDNIRQTIIDEYTEWVSKDVCGEGEDLIAPEVYVEQYLEELGDGGYKTVSSSTDFSLYDDDEVKVFAKDLRTYDEITLQYVGIMPKTIALEDYIRNLTTDKLSATIGRLKTIEFDNFKDGVITNIVANIPVFKFQDKLDLVDTLQSIGITDIFSETKANLSNLVNDPAGLYIGNAVHQTTVDFSNDGIKASAATALIGGKGSSGCGFYYDFEVPIEKIDLTFDNPYLFLIRDKESGEVWFVGTVYEPTVYTQPSY